MTHRCEDLDPCAILGRTVCLQSVSKDVEGEFGPPDSERRQCREPECLTLTSLQTLTLKLGSHSDCDRVPELDGALEIRDLAHVFDDNGNERGVRRLSALPRPGTRGAPARHDLPPSGAPVRRLQRRGRVPAAD
jgi:hypothetical protein